MIAGVIQQARHLLSSSSAHTGARFVHYHSQRFAMTRMVKPLTETELHPELNLNGGGGGGWGGGGRGGCIRHAGVSLVSIVGCQPEARA